MADVGRRPLEIASLWVTRSGAVFPAQRILAVGEAQDSMGLGEERMYQRIWNERSSLYFHVLQETKNNKTPRVVRVGSKVLSKVCNLNEKTVRDLLPKMIEKKIFVVLEKGTTVTSTGTTYRIGSYGDILTWQREAGLLFFVRNGRAIEFVKPYIPTGGTPPGDHGFATPTVETPPGPVTPLAPPGTLPPDPTGATPPLIDKDKNYRHSSTTAESLEAAIAAMTRGWHRAGDMETRGKLLQLDRGALSLVIEAAQLKTENMSGEELAAFLVPAFHVLASNKRVNNPIGVLIRRPENWVEPEKVRKYREQKAREQVEQEALERRLREEFGDKY